MNVQLTFSHEAFSGKVDLDLSPLKTWWEGVQARVASLRASDAGDPRPDVAYARCGCPCGAGPEHVLTDGVLRLCTRCREGV
jgi:hypothetical protein